jgi:hypothetical protein
MSIIPTWAHILYIHYIYIYIYELHKARTFRTLHWRVNFKNITINRTKDVRIYGSSQAQARPLTNMLHRDGYFFIFFFLIQWRFTSSSVKEYISGIWSPLINLCSTYTQESKIQQSPNNPQPLVGSKLKIDTQINLSIPW